MCREPVCFDSCKIILRVGKVKHILLTSSLLHCPCLVHVLLQVCLLFPYLYLWPAGLCELGAQQHYRLLYCLHSRLLSQSIKTLFTTLYNTLGSSSTLIVINGPWADHTCLTLWRLPIRMRLTATYVSSDLPERTISHSNSRSVTPTSRNQQNVAKCIWRNSLPCCVPSSAPSVPLLQN